MLLELLDKATKENPLIRVGDDRKLRKEIEELRRQGVRVVSSSHQKGYWIAKDENEYLQFRKEQMSRVAKITSVVMAMDKNLLGQIKMEVEK